MGKVMAGMTMSLDGFINDHHGSAESLSPDFEELLKTPSFKEMTANTGAVIGETYLRDGRSLYVD